MQFNITTMLFNLLQAAIDTTALAPATPVAQENTFSLIEMAVKGGWLMLVLLILSIVAIYIFGNKWWMIRKAGQIDKNFMKDIHDQIHDGKIKSAIALSRDTTHLLQDLSRRESKESDVRSRISRLLWRTWEM